MMRKGLYVFVIIAAADVAAAVVKEWRRYKRQEALFEFCAGGFPCRTTKK